MLRDGDAVFESYGAKCNKRFFASYGFCLEGHVTVGLVSSSCRVTADNPANEVTICIPGDLVMDQKLGPQHKRSQMYVDCGCLRLPLPLRLHAIAFA